MFEKRCMQCGAVGTMGARFCDSCGASLTDTAASPAPPQPPPFPGSLPKAPPPMPQPRPVLQQSGQMDPQNNRAVWSLVLGIVGFMFCGPFTAIPGMILGKKELNAIRAGQSPASNEGVAKAGFYISIGVTILYGLILLLVMGIAVVSVLMQASAP